MKNTNTQKQEKRYIRIKAEMQGNVTDRNIITREETARQPMHPLHYWASPNFFLNPVPKK
jgi:hypothetical protein